jgi:GDP-4-dehydro-6-deoxy-D-mannose reductase
MRALITGISGFVGSHLAEHLRGSGATVYGISRHPSPTGAAAHAAGSLLDEHFLRRTVLEVRPTHVFHCAALIGGDDDAEALYETNVLGTLHLFAAFSAADLHPTVVVAGSSAVYGRPKLLPVTEEHPLAPMTHYAASKIGQEMVALSRFHSFGLRVIRARTFNLVGPRQPQTLVTSSLARQIADAERGGSRTVRVGNVHPLRDYTDVRDAVRAYALLAEHGVGGEVYNVCSGKGRSVREALDALVAQARVGIDVQIDRQRLRATDIDEQRGSFERLRAATGWQPSVPFEQSLTDLLDDWRARLGAPAALTDGPRG